MSLKDDLFGLKSKLENIEDEFENKLKEVEDKETKFKKMDEQIEEFISQKDALIKLNVGGKYFQTRISTLLSVKDTLFNRIISSAVDNKETLTELFFDRSFDHFHIILDYLRTKEFNPKGLPKTEIEEILLETEYYNITGISSILAERLKEVEFVNFESSPRHGTTATHNVNDLNDKSCMKGICVGSPYFIIIEMNYDHEFDKIEVGGYAGNSSVWYAGNGANSNIFTSNDKKTWTNVGKLPSDYNGTVKSVSLKKTIAKYIKFEHNSYLGIGYLKVFRYGSN